MKIATGIPTEDWSKIIKGLQIEGWKVSCEYFNFDKGIDFDFYILTKSSEEIVFGWDNWMKGEIKCSELRMSKIQKNYAYEFNFGEPINLKPEIIKSMKLYFKPLNYLIRFLTFWK